MAAGQSVVSALSFGTLLSLSSDCSAGGPALCSTLFLMGIGASHSSGPEPVDKTDVEKKKKPLNFPLTIGGQLSYNPLHPACEGRTILELLKAP